MSDTQADDGGEQRVTNSIAEALDLDIDEATGGLDFDFSENGEDYDQWTRHDRSMTFDVLWTHLEEAGRDPAFPEDVDDDVVQALIDDTDHRYRIDLPDQTRETGVTGIALMAFLDSEATVVVADE